MTSLVTVLRVLDLDIGAFLYFGVTKALAAGNRWRFKKHLEELTIFSSVEMLRNILWYAREPSRDHSPSGPITPGSENAQSFTRMHFHAHFHVQTKAIGFTTFANSFTQQLDARKKLSPRTRR